MKKIIIAITCMYFLSACSIFKKNVKYGCPGSPQPGQLSTDQKIAKGENVKQSKYKGGRKIY